MTLPPLPMRPHFVEKLWGGSRLAALPAKQRDGHRPPSAVAIGESWEVSDLDGAQSVVDDHAICRDLVGLTLGDLVARFGHDLIGNSAPTGRFPILVKLIDAAEMLSVQVHPDAHYAAAHTGVFSKDEAWLVVGAAEGACVLHGFVDGVSRELFLDATRRGLPHELMRTVPIKRGDVLHVSPGIVHAIGAGAVILEVQEPSDTTFRVWDFDRTDSHGHKRALHLDQALDVARFSNDSAQPPPLTMPTYDGDSALLCETRAFSMRALDLGGREQALRTDGRHAFVLHAEQGDVVLVHDGVELVLPRGASCVIPATCGTVTFPARGAASRVVVMR